MTTNEKVEQDLKEAMLAKDTEKLSVLRLLKTAVKNAEIAKKEDLTEAEVLSVLEKQAKQRRDSIEQYENGNRSDLAEKERNELALIESYLPAKMSEEELAKVVQETIAELGATSMADMGRVMKEVMAKTAGAADGKLVSDQVRKDLS